ncbi:hypothetical protein EDF64_11729 [Curtobacterium flaccumfaciens]|uniref:Lipoprotein n=1 Tax=Curtobacterium flaccumfaciens TaxID=2035 RepID=A0A4V3BK63_9MICO|nr:hypothetical protein [Curtobacterium flaccumfaciens]TDN41632.1 hypothetical protein EDF64_11729 [Curtobacterium flaccumfaciens]
MRRRTCWASSLLLTVVVLSGCAGAPDGTSGADSPEAGDYSAAGPWAGEFAEAAAADLSDYQSRIIEDGEITAAELLEAQARASACMEDLGHRYTTSDDGRSESEPLPGHEDDGVDTVNGYMVRCSGTYDSTVTQLFNEIRRNPEKQDEAEISVACLRAAGLVDRGYTERRWRDEYDAGVFSFDEWSADAVQCREDPLGLWRDR